MSATAFQRMRREAAAKKNAAVVSKAAEKECEIAEESCKTDVATEDAEDERETEKETVKSKRTRKK